MCLENLHLCGFLETSRSHIALWLGPRQDNENTLREVEEARNLRPLPGAYRFFRSKNHPQHAALTWRSRFIYCLLWVVQRCLAEWYLCRKSLSRFLSNNLGEGDSATWFVAIASALMMKDGGSGQPTAGWFVGCRVSPVPAAVLLCEKEIRVRCVA